MKITRRELRQIINEAILSEANAAHRRLWQEIEAQTEQYRREASAKLLNKLTGGENYTAEDIKKAQGELDTLIRKFGDGNNLLNDALDKYDQFKADHPYIMGAAEFIIGFTPVGIAFDAAGMYQALRSGDPQQIMAAGIGFLPGTDGYSPKVVQEISDSVIKTAGSEFASSQGFANDAFANATIVDSVSNGIGFAELIKKVNEEEEEAFKKQFFAAIGDMADAAESQAKQNAAEIKAVGEGLGAAADAVASALGAPSGVASAALKAQKKKKKTVSENVTSSEILKEWLA